MTLDMDEPFSVEALIENPSFVAWILKGEEQEAKYWEQYLLERPEERLIVEQAQSLLLGLNRHFENQGLSAAHIESKLGAQMERLGNPPSLKHKSAKSLSVRSYRIAATVLLVILGAVWFWWKIGEQNLRHETDFAEWKTVELSDGSLVQLNANSSLRLDKTWKAGETRQVWLEGEAYFQVSKQTETDARFQVITNGLMVEVLGTSFNVYSRGEQTEVFLEEGKVRLELDAKNTEEVMLQPGEKLAYSAGRKSIIDLNKAEVDIQLSWKEGLFKFDKKPVREILQEIQEIYGIRFQVEHKEILDRPITSQGVPMEHLEVALPILARAMEVDISFENDLYIIK